jgi:hypothetical protein
MPKRPPAFYTPCLSDAVMKSEPNLIGSVKQWLAYYVTLARKSKLTSRETAELNAARSFIAEVSCLLNAPKEEFASATPTQRKEVSNQASDAMKLVEAALARQWRADLLDLI